MYTLQRKKLRFTKELTYIRLYNIAFGEYLFSQKVVDKPTCICTYISPRTSLFIILTINIFEERGREFFSVSSLSFFPFLSTSAPRLWHPCSFSLAFSSALISKKITETPSNRLSSGVLRLFLLSLSFPPYLFSFIMLFNSLHIAFFLLECVTRPIFYLQFDKKL